MNARRSGVSSSSSSSCSYGRRCQFRRSRVIYPRSRSARGTWAAGGRPMDAASAVMSRSEAPTIFASRAGSTACQLRQTNSWRRSGKWRLIRGAGASPAGNNVSAAKPPPAPPRAARPAQMSAMRPLRWRRENGVWSATARPGRVEWRGGLSTGSGPGARAPGERGAGRADEMADHAPTLTGTGAGVNPRGGGATPSLSAGAVSVIVSRSWQSDADSIRFI